MTERDRVDVNDGCPGPGGDDRRRLDADQVVAVDDGGDLPDPGSV